MFFNNLFSALPRQLGAAFRLRRRLPLYPPKRYRRAWQGYTYNEAGNPPARTSSTFLRMTRSPASRRPWVQTTALVLSRRYASILRPDHLPSLLERNRCPRVIGEVW